MLTGLREVGLSTLLLLAGCAGPGVDEPDQCLLGGAPRDVPDHREAFNLTEDLLDRLPVLSHLFENSTPTITIDCGEGRALFETLEAQGADVVLYAEPTGHNAYLQYNATLRYVVLRARI